MADYRCKPGDVCMSEAMPFAQSWEVRTTYPLDECIKNPSFLMNVRSFFRAGHRINLCRYVSETWGEVIEVCDGLRVRLVDAQGVDLIKTQEIVRTGSDAEPGIVVSRGFRGRFVVRQDGAVILERNTIVEANEEAQKLSMETGKPVKLYEHPKKAA